MQTSRTDRGLRIAIGVLLATFVYVIFLSIHERLVAVGDDAPTFSIAADNGRTISVNDFGGKLLVLNFWATWCATCMEEIPSLDQFQRELGGSGVVVLGVSVDKDEKAYRRFLSRAKVSFLTARDPQSKISADYGTFRYPETYIINSSGKVVLKVVSSTDWTDQRMVTYVRSLLSASS
jgi:cytochrome c biogenesis protein CcmG/thiol:disulfide interchange protein DsbE